MEETAMTARIAGILMAVLVGVTTAPVAAQSLGDVARQESARREQIKKPTKVFTNADLPTAAVEGEAPASDAPSAEPVSGEAPAPERAAARPAVSAAQPPADDEAGWKGRAAQINGKVAEAQDAVRLLKALSDRLGLEMQASNPAIAQRAASERADVKARLVQAEQKAAAALEVQDAFRREAKAAGVPPDWIQ